MVGANAFGIFTCRKLAVSDFVVVKSYSRSNYARTVLTKLPGSKVKLYLMN